MVCPWRFNSLVGHSRTTEYSHSVASLNRSLNHSFSKEKGVITMLHHGSTSSEELAAITPTQTGSLTRGQKRECKVQTAINTPAMLAGLESFEAGSEYDFAYWYDEAHIVIRGHATIECTLPPFHQE